MVSPLKYNASIEQHKNATELALQIPIANFRDGYFLRKRWCTC